LTAADPHKAPFTLVFSPSEKLVSRPERLSSIAPNGLAFEEVLGERPGLFSRLMEENGNAPARLRFCPLQEDYSYSSHVMKDPEGNRLALIVTLIRPEPRESGVELDDKMVHMDRLAQVGQLAAGIAHEIRNPLAGIHTNVQVLSEMLASDESFQRFFDVILGEIDRVEKIIRDLLNYARMSKPVFRPCSIEEVFRHVETLIAARLAKHHVRLKLFKEESLPPIPADSGQLVQIFLNCIMNSLQAMPGGGPIEIRAAVPEHADELKVSIRDRGAGIDEEALPRIFEPFFTTRAKGLGLGLAVIRKIMEDHRGRITVQSTPGQGTEVALFFPLS
jgi:signal transduction histidine kinase